jgi:NADPH-dependent 7-cyano-7-deazaguanine reductase QueF
LSNARKSPKKRKRLNRYFTHFQELSKTLEEGTSGVMEDTITVTNGNKLKAKVIITSPEHCLGTQQMI